MFTRFTTRQSADGTARGRRAGLLRIAALLALGMLFTVGLGAPSASAATRTRVPAYKVGECIRNLGTNTAPRLARTTCTYGEGKLKILAKRPYVSNALTYCTNRYRASNAAYSVYAYTEYLRNGRVVSRTFNSRKSYVLCLRQL